MNRIRIGPIDIYGCHDALERLEPYIDDELTATERRRVNFHLGFCRQCAPLFRFEGRLDDHIRHNLTTTQIPPHLHTRMQTALKGAQQNDSPPNS